MTESDKFSVRPPRLTWNVLNEVEPVNVVEALMDRPSMETILSPAATPARSAKLPFETDDTLQPSLPHEADTPRKERTLVTLRPSLDNGGVTLTFR